MHAKIFVLDHHATCLRQFSRHVQILLGVFGGCRQSRTQIGFFAILRDCQAIDGANIDAGITFDTQLLDEHCLDIAVQATLYFLDGLFHRKAKLNFDIEFLEPFEKLHS